MDYIKVSAAAKAVGVTAWTLKNWESLFGWQVPRDDRGHRVYTQELVNQARAVKNQLNEGVSMAELMGYAKPAHEHGYNPWGRRTEPSAVGPEY